MNRVDLVGRMARNPELRQTQNGISVCSFAVAVDKRTLEPDGTRGADFFNCVAWRSTADFVSKYFTKGKPIGLCGHLQTRSYTDQNGQNRYATEVVAESVEFVGSKSDGGDGAQAVAPVPRYAPPVTHTPNTGGQYDPIFGSGDATSEADLPF